LKSSGKPLEKLLREFFRMIGYIRCIVNPTEDPERVERALLNLFPESSIEERLLDVGTELTLKIKDRTSLEQLKQMIHNTRIIDAVRSRLEKNWNGANTIIRFDKQVAYVSRLRLMDDSEENPPLGFIEMQIDSKNDDDFEQFKRWFTPPTRNGKVVLD